MRRVLILFLIFSSGVATYSVQKTSSFPAAVNTVEGSFLLTHAEVPLYPPVARRARISGSVHMIVTLINGTVVDVNVQSSESKFLVNEAEKNVRTWQFEQDTNGKFEVTFIYQMDDKEVLSPVNPRVEMYLPHLVKVTAKPVKPNTLD
jgi:TonB family protein